MTKEKTEPTALLFRESLIEAASIVKENREVPICFSSEEPVLRYDYESGREYQEILDHSPGNADFSRLNNGGAFLVNHDSREQVGSFKSGSVKLGDDKRGRGIVKLSRSVRGEEIFQDILDGIRSLVSFGYRTTKELKREIIAGVETRRYAFMAFEASTVPIPADTTVGVARNENNFNQTKTMSDTATIPAPAPTPNLEVLRDDARKFELTRSNEIRSYADKWKNTPAIGEIAGKAINEGWSVEQFRKAAFEALPNTAPIQNIPNPLAQVSARDWKQYSLVRAINGLCPGGRLDGLEREVSDEISLKYGKRAGGAWIPPQMLNESFVNGERSLVAGTGTLGGFNVSTPNMGDMFIELLRNRAKVLALGARTISLSNPITIPRQSGAGSTNWVGESVASTLSVGNFTQVTLTPQAISAYQQYSKLLLNESNPSIDGLVRADIIEQLALAVDLAALHGSGSGQPTGIAATTGIGTVALAANGQALPNTTAYPFLVSLETAIGAANADVASMSYLMRSAHRGSLKTSARFANSDTPVWEPNNTVNGYRAEVSNQIATNLTTGTATTICSAIFFGNWADLLVADFFGGVDLTVDPYTAGANGVVRLYARKWVDIAVRHPASFALGGGILA